MQIPFGSKFKPLNQTPEDRAAQADQKLKDVARQYEKHFLGEMMKAMRSTVSESGFVKVNQGEKIFREELDGEYVDKWSQKGGIGLADIIYDQLIDKYGPQMGLQKKDLTKPTGPLMLDEKSSIKMKHSSMGEKSTFQFTPDAQNKPAKPLAVQAPWAGRLAQKLKLGADEYFLKIQHDNGIQSDFKFNGLLGQMNEGDQLVDGQVLGYLNPDFNSMIWSHSQKNVSE